MKKKLILLFACSIAILTKAQQPTSCFPTTANAQSAFPLRINSSANCATPNSNIIGDLESSAYVPNASMPTLQFRVNFVILEHPTQPTVFTGISHSVIVADANNLVANMNSWYQTCGSIPQVLTPPNPSPLVANPKIQLTLNHVYFDTSSTAAIGAYYSNPVFYNAFPHDTSNTLNIYFYTDPTSAAGSGRGPYAQFAYIAIGTPSNGGVYQPGTIITNPRLLWHELGHALGCLGDNYIGSLNNNDDPVTVTILSSLGYKPFDSAIDIAANYTCSIPTSAATATNANNNLMGSSFCREALSAKQIAAFHYLVAKNVTKKFTQFNNLPYPYTPPLLSPNFYTYTSTATYTSIPNDFDSIIVKSGANITFSAALLPARPNAKIIVEKGAKLTFNCVNAYCSKLNGLWNGVDVYGDATLPQTASNQGTFVINNSVIQNTRVGINVGKRINNITFDQNSGGGIVQSSNSNYSYNMVDVEFAPYFWRRRTYVGPSTTGMAVVENLSRFRTDQFLTDSVATGQHKNSAVILNSVYGVRFEGCNFTSNSNFVNSGIYSLNSSFIVKPFNNAQCSFVGFINAIYANSTSYNSPIVIDSAQFNYSKNNSIFLANVLNPRISNNAFTIANFSSATATATGLYLNNCTGYIVENNNFYGANSVNTVGSYIRQSGPYANSVYNNIFNSLQQGLWVVGQNYDPATLGSPGLMINCNDFSNCQYDIGVYKSGRSVINLPNNTGISPTQGVANTAFETDNVRNTYNVLGCNSGAENKYNINTGNSFTVTNHGSFLGVQFHPIPQTSASCSNSLELIDVVGSNGPASTVKLSYCPINVLPSLNRTALQQQISSLSQTITTLTNTNKNNQYTAQIQLLTNRLGQAYNEKIRRFTSDTTAGTADSLLAIYNNPVIANGQVFIANIYTTFDRYADATSILNSLNLKGGLYTDYVFVQNEVLQLEHSPNYIQTMSQDLAKKNKIINIQASGNYLAEGIASALLQKVWGIKQLDEEKPTPFSNNGRLMNTPSSEGTSDDVIQLSDNVMVYPNPAKDLLYIKLFTMIDEPIVINVLDITGKVLLTQSFSYDCSINLQYLDGGIYFVNLVTKNNIISTKKIVVIK